MSTDTAYPNLEAELARKGYTRETVSKLLNVSLGTATCKLNDVKRMKLQEAFKIRDTLFPDLDIDYLFKRGA